MIFLPLQLITDVRCTLLFSRILKAKLKGG